MITSDAISQDAKELSVTTTEAEDDDSASRPAAVAHKAQPRQRPPATSSHQAQHDRENEG